MRILILENKVVKSCGRVIRLQKEVAVITLACFSMVRVGGMTRPFSRSAGCITSGCKCGGRSGRMCPAHK